MRRLIVRKDTVQGNRIHITDKEDITYLSVVLRMKDGEKLLVSDGEGKAWETVIDYYSREKIELMILSEQPVTEEIKTRVTLYQGLPKGNKLEDVIRKTTELGIYRIVPLGTKRAIPDADDISKTRIERWNRVAKEACRQSGRIYIPEICRTQGFDETAAGLTDMAYDLILVLFELERELTLKHELQRIKEQFPNKALNIAVFVGPEGGFELREAERLVQEGAKAVTMGENILRTETAGPAALAMILYELEMNGV